MPGRVEAFLTACALVAGRRENDVGELVKDVRSLGKQMEPVAKMLNPARQ